MPDCNNFCITAAIASAFCRWASAELRDRDSAATVTNARSGMTVNTAWPVVTTTGADDCTCGSCAATEGVVMSAQASTVHAATSFICDHFRRRKASLTRVIEPNMRLENRCCRSNCRAAAYADRRSVDTPDRRSPSHRHGLYASNRCRDLAG